MKWHRCKQGLHENEWPIRHELPLFYKDSSLHNEKQTWRRNKDNCHF